jgi:hypothetical protein
MPKNCTDVTELELVKDDVVPTEIDATRIVFASLYTYADDKDTSAFQKIYLPPVCVSVGDLEAMFYQSKLRRFTPFVLNKLVGAVSKLPLLEAVLANYEEVTGNDRSSLSAQQKILLRQELATAKINSRIQRIVHMDISEFRESFDDMLMWFDEVEHVDEVRDASNNITTEGVVGQYSVRTSVEIHVFSEALQTGIILIVQFIVTRDEYFEWVLLPSALQIFYDLLNGASSQGPQCNLCITYNQSGEPE